jgi:hypothetical protein
MALWEWPSARLEVWVNQGKKEREGDSVGNVMASVYIALMVACLWQGLQTRQDYAAKECARHSNDCQTRAQR